MRFEIQTVMINFVKFKHFPHLQFPSHATPCKRKRNLFTQKLLNTGESMLQSCILLLKKTQLTNTVLQCRHCPTSNIVRPCWNVIFPVFCGVAPQALMVCRQCGQDYDSSPSDGFSVRVQVLWPTDGTGSCRGYGLWALWSGSGMCRS